MSDPLTSYLRAKMRESRESRARMNDEFDLTIQSGRDAYRERLSRNAEGCKSGVGVDDLAEAFVPLRHIDYLLDCADETAALERVAKAALQFQTADKAYDNSLMSPDSQERFQDLGMAMRAVIGECEVLPAPLRERLMRDDA